MHEWTDFKVLYLLNNHPQILTLWIEKRSERIKRILRFLQSEHFWYILVCWRCRLFLSFLLFFFWWLQAKRSQNSGYFLHFIALIFCSFRGNGFTFNGIDMQLNHITACLSSDKCDVFYGPSTFKWIFCSKLSRWTFNCLPEFRSCLYPSCRISSGRLIKRILWWLVANVGQWKI